MAKYVVKITEQLERTYVIEAKSYEAAKEAIEDAYKFEKIEPLGAEDFVKYDIEKTQTFGTEAISENDERASYYEKYNW